MVLHIVYMETKLDKIKRVSEIDREVSDIRASNISHFISKPMGDSRITALYSERKEILSSMKSIESENYDDNGVCAVGKFLVDIREFDCPNEGDSFILTFSDGSVLQLKTSEWTMGVHEIV